MVNVTGKSLNSNHDKTNKIHIRSDKKLSVIVVVAGSLVSILEKKKLRPYGRIARQLSEN